mmetsp:Transcript_129659/g.252503  ORF Transcript_129659/g.252503 Transcript_129659/m.252503 type:complete len:380 (-) Transcript_129659:33-1172(-)
MEGEPLETLSVKELRRRLAEKGLDARGCLEKADLVQQLQDADEAHPVVSMPSPCKGNTIHNAQCGKHMLLTLRVPELQGLLVKHGMQEALSSAREKEELVEALAPKLAQCPICLDSAGVDIDNAIGKRTEIRCDGCRAPFHRNCAAGHMKAAAEAGSLPLCCPIPACKERWRAPMVTWALNEQELDQYNACVRNVRELRQQTSQSNGSIPSALASPRTTQRLKELGIRACPRCGAFIEKQAAGITHGCDKMTCRCGCKFCFLCGMTAGTDGRARCSCVEERHSFLSHAEVLNNYGNSIENNDFARAATAAATAAANAFTQMPRGNMSHPVAAMVQSVLQQMHPLQGNDQSSAQGPWHLHGTTGPGWLPQGPPNFQYFRP